jgi:HK97 family phage major capsid protein
MRKDILKKKLARLQAKKTGLAARCQASTDVAEVRSLTADLEDVNAEIEETQAELDAIEAEEARSNNPAAADYFATPAPADAVPVNGTVRASAQMQTAEQRSENKYETMEYRQAFRDYVINGTAIPAEYRQDTTSTEDTGAAIPVTVMNDVINTVRKRYGNLYNKVRKLAVKGGVEFPVGALQASFKWISEGTVSPRQKVGSLGKVSFSYHTLEIRVSQTFLSQILTLSSFEARMAEAIAVAYLQAMDYGIVNGSGDGTMLGILNDPRVTNTVTMTAADINDWKKWRTKFFKTLPLGYRAGEFIFPLSTVDTYLETMSDANGNPIFRQATGLEVNDGDATNPNGRFFGRAISLVEEDIIADFDTASAGDVIGLFWQPQEYAINENFAFTMRRYFDEETNEWIDKALVVADGKVLNPTGFVKIIKG